MRTTDRQAPGKHYVYRIFDKYDELIYVGMTQDVNGRMIHHRSGAINPWSIYVDHWTSETHPDRVTARAAEQALIAETCPPFNKNHSSGSSAEDYKARWMAQEPPADEEAIRGLYAAFGLTP